MYSVSFGDSPAGNIAIAALRKTAAMGKGKYPEAAHVVFKNTYVDDIVDSLQDQKVAIKMMKKIVELIKPGGFAIKNQ